MWEDWEVGVQRIDKKIVLENNIWVEEVAQWSRVSAALPQDSSSVPRIHVRQLKADWNSNCRVPGALFLSPQAAALACAYPHTDTHIHIWVLKKSYKNKMLASVIKSSTAKAHGLKCLIFFVAFSLEVTQFTNHPSILILLAHELTKSSTPKDEWIVVLALCVFEGLCKKGPDF